MSNRGRERRETGTGSLVTVVIPAYNAVNYLPDTLRSVLTQTHERIEVLVIDDGSTDGTAELAGSTGDPRVTVSSFENAGLAAARNRGLAAASGEVIAFLDSDDLWDPQKVERQLAVLAAPGVVGVGSKMRYLAADGRGAGECGVDPTPDEIQENIRQALGMPFPISSMLFKADAVRAVEGFDETLKQVEDLDFVSRVAAQGLVSWVPEVLGGYRVHSGSMTATGHGEQRRITQFVQARAKARASGGDLAWAEFAPADVPTLRQRRQDLGAVWFRAAGVSVMNRKYLSAIGYALGAGALRPRYTARRALLRSGISD